jgi:hypothetical protein
MFNVKHREDVRKFKSEEPVYKEIVYGPYNTAAEAFQACKTLAQEQKKRWLDEEDFLNEEDFVIRTSTNGVWIEECSNTNQTVAATWVIMKI